MKPASVLRFALTCFLCWAAFWPVTKAQKATVVTDWRAELAKAKAAIKKNPKSAFWHNQAGVAYNAIGDFDSAVKEIKLAITLDASDPINYYTLYSVYQRKGMQTEQRQVLLDALEQLIHILPINIALRKSRSTTDSIPCVHIACPSSDSMSYLTNPAMSCGARMADRWRFRSG